MGQYHSHQAMIYSPESAWSTPDATAAYDAGIAVPECCGRILANVASREGWKIGSGGWLCSIFALLGVFTGTGTGSQAQSDTTSNAILAKSDRKELLVVSPDKRGRRWSKENGIESNVLITGNGVACGGSIPGHCSLRNVSSLRRKARWWSLRCQRWGVGGMPSGCHVQFGVLAHYEK